MLLSEAGTHNIKVCLPKLLNGHGGTKPAKVRVVVYSMIRVMNGSELIAKPCEEFQPSGFFQQLCPLVPLLVKVPPKISQHLWWGK